MNIIVIVHSWDCSKILILVHTKCHRSLEEVVMYSLAPSTATENTFVERICDFLPFSFIRRKDW